MKKYKYLVVCGCSLTYGTDCPVEQTYPKLLADRLGLELINLATPGAGWLTLEAVVASFINNNQDIIKDCFFILQQSLLERELPKEHTPIHKSDVWEKWNVSFLPQTVVTYHGYNDWNAYDYYNVKPDWWDSIDPQNKRPWGSNMPKTSQEKLIHEHSHSNSNNIIISYLYEKFEEIMLYWATRTSSFHLFLKNLSIDHIIVDGYSPFMSYKLNFTNYYESVHEYNIITMHWSRTNKLVSGEVALYDFKNIKSGWLFDKIDIKYKVDDVVLHSLFSLKRDKQWNTDGAHAGPLGMKLIADVLHKNLLDKKWME